MEGNLRERLRAAEFEDLETFLRDAKEHGDEVQYWVSREALEAAGITVSQLVECVDGAMAEEDFVQAATGSILMTF